MRAMKFFAGIAFAVVLASGLVGIKPAAATTLNFSLTGDYNLSWTMDSNPTPTGTSPADESTFFLGVPGIDPLYLMFFGTGTGSGGIRVSSGTDITTEVGAIFDLAGPQIFGGTLAAPVFTPGEYVMIYDFVVLPNRAPLTTTKLTITTAAVATTPIPAALPLFASALGGIGFLGWRRRKSASAAA